MKSIVSNLKAYDTKYPGLRFIVSFTILMGLFYTGSVTPIFNQNLIPAYLHFNAKISEIILEWLGQKNIIVTGATIFSPTFSFSIEIKRGCEAIDATALLISAILTSHTPFLLKITGIVLGTLLLLILNLARIIGLFFTGIHYPQLFKIMHIEVLPILFILFATLFFVLWLMWATQHKMFRQNAPD